MSEKKFTLTATLLWAVYLWSGVACGQATPVREAPVASAIESITPADAMVLVQVKNLSAIEDGFSKTALAETLNRVELLASVKEVFKNAARFLVVYVTDTPSEEVKKMVNRGIGLVLLPAKDQFQRPPAALIVDVSGGKTAFETMLNGKIIPRLKTFAERATLQSEDVLGITVQKFTVPGRQTICFALVGEAFVIGLEPAVRSLIATAKGQNPSLATIPAYQSARQGADVAAGALTYVNLSGIYAMHEADWKDDPRQKAGLEALGLLGIQGIAISAAFEGRGVRERVFLATGKEKTGLLKHFADQPPRAPTSVALVPQGFSLYAAFQSGGGPKLYQALKGFIQQVQGEEGLTRMQAVEAAFQQNAQLDIEMDLFGPLGNEAFLAVDLRKVVEAALARRPQFADFQFILGAEVEDAAKLEGSLAQLFFSQFFINQGVTVNKMRYKNSDFNVLSTPRNPNLSITYAFLDKFVLFASSTETMKIVVDAMEAKTSLATSADFAQVQAMLPKESNFMAYFDTKSVLPAVMTLIAERAPRGFRPFLPAVRALAEPMTGMGATVVNASEGIRGEAFSPVGAPFWLATLASIGKLSQAPVQGRLGQVMARMGQTEFAIRRFRAATGRYPTALGELVPVYLPRVPVDPFSPERAEIGYVLLAGGPAMPTAPVPGGAPAAGAPPAAAPAQTRGPADAAYLLISVGPDGKKDIDPQDPSLPQLLSKVNAPSPQDIAALKAKIYQFRKEALPEERALDDTGDIVRAGK